jgi:hypothetical protein
MKSGLRPARTEVAYRILIFSERHITSLWA